MNKLPNVIISEIFKFDNTYYLEYNNIIKDLNTKFKKYNDLYDYHLNIVNISYQSESITFDYKNSINWLDKYGSKIYNFIVTAS